MTSAVNLLLSLPQVASLVANCQANAVVDALRDIMAKRAYTVVDLRRALNVEDGLQHDAEEALGKLLDALQPVTGDEVQVGNGLYFGE